eukprot:509808-Rhodomonas_salina.1
MYALLTIRPGTKTRSANHPVQTVQYCALQVQTAPYCATPLLRAVWAGHFPVIAPDTPPTPCP